MLKKHVILLETEKNIWVAYSISNGEANKMSSAYLPQLNYYVFECNLLQQYPYTMKLKYPLNKYYHLHKISKYNEEWFAEEDEYLIVSYNNSDESSFLDVGISNHNNIKPAF